MITLYSDSNYLISISMNMILSGIILLTLTPLAYSLKDSVAAMISAAVSAMVLMNGMVYYMHSPMIEDLLILVSAASLYITGYLLSSVRGFRFTFVFLTVYVLNRFAAFITGGATAAIYSLPVAYIAVQTLIIAAFVLILKTYIKKPFTDMIYEIQENWGTLCILPLLFNIAFYRFNAFSVHHDADILHARINILLFLLCFIIYYVIYLHFRDVSSTLLLQKDAEMLELQKEYQKKEYMEVLSRLDSLRIYRHDMRHHLNMISSLISSGDVDMAKKYIEDLNCRFAGQNTYEVK